MAASSSPNNSSNRSAIHSLSNGHDPDTTFVQTDPETFREVVQRLTGAAAGSRDSAAFNLHERRTTVRELKIKLQSHNGGGGALHSLSSTASNRRAVMESPVSPLEYAGSPATPTDEEERAIAEKGFYLHPNPFGTPAGSDPPELLPLFPLHSPIN
ncbi:VQ motif-containing protein 11-like [Salvia divinorum]|uniref:VQ motif-containing protein 11-like n=1 Tax=Salvia divinorum TaxID=28513 RepID=A0ABD1HFT1_SALDI